MLLYDFQTGCFVLEGETENADLTQLQLSNKRAQEIEDGTSPLVKKSTVKKGMSESPTKLARQGTVAIAKSPSKVRKGKAAKVEGEKKEKKESTLASPTSNSMQNSFIIKNADESFDAYYQVMKKRRLGQGASTIMDASLTGTSPQAP